MEAPRPGDRIGLFELVAPIGSGSAGTVFRAVHTQTKADVALKLVHESRAAFFKRVYLELDTLRSIRHENVVRVYAAGRHGPWAYLAMEFVPGVPMRTWVEAASPNERIDRILRVGAQISEHRLEHIVSGARREHRRDRAPGRGGVQAQRHQGEPAPRAHAARAREELADRVT